MTWQIPEDVPLFTMLTVARAAGVAPATMRVWFQRGHVSLRDNDSPRHTNGAPNKFTLQSVLMMAVTGELVRLGLQPGNAFKCAEHWMDHGVVAGEEGAPARREHGGLFPLPFMTYLVVGADGEDLPESAYPCRIDAINPRDVNAHSAFFNTLFFRGRSSARVVLLNLVDRRVRQLCWEVTLDKKAPPEPDWEIVAKKMLDAEGDTTGAGSDYE